MPRAIILACLLLAACHRRQRAETPWEDMKVEEWQNARAVDAANRFREVFNDGSCAPIYAAAAPYFRSQDSLEWASECERLKKELGTWRRFQIAFTERCAMPEVVVCVTGAAEFEKGRTEIGLAWLLDKNGTRLFWIALKESEQHWRQIPQRPLLRRLIDPPPIRAIQNGTPS